jgi:TATA-binding protein-associated factor Taf7
LPAVSEQPYSCSHFESATIPENPAEDPSLSRDYEPEKGQWYEDLDREDSFRVLSVDPDIATVRIQWLDGEVEDLDVDEWHELDLELAAEPEGWVDEDAEEEDEQEEDDEDWDDEDDEDEDWDDDEDDDYDDEDDEYRDRE